MITSSEKKYMHTCNDQSSVTKREREKSLKQIKPKKLKLKQKKEFNQSINQQSYIVCVFVCVCMQVFFYHEKKEKNKFTDYSQDSSLDNHQKL